MEWSQGKHRDVQVCIACDWPRGLCDCDQFTPDAPLPGDVDPETAGTRAFAAAVGMVTK